MIAKNSQTLPGQRPQAGEEVGGVRVGVKSQGWALAMNGSGPLAVNGSGPHGRSGVSLGNLGPGKWRNGIQRWEKPAVGVQGPWV